MIKKEIWVFCLGCLVLLYGNVNYNFSLLVYGLKKLRFEIK